MSLQSLHDRVRNLGLGAMFEKHERSAFRGLLDDRSPEWGATAVTQKVVDFNAFESAGVSAGEIIAHYRQTMRDGGTPGVLDSLAETLAAYRAAGFRPAQPEDVAAAGDRLHAAPGAPAPGTAPGPAPAAGAVAREFFGDMPVETGDLVPPPDEPAAPPG
jgi:hypothetical protein